MIVSRFKPDLLKVLALSNCPIYNIKASQSTVNLSQSNSLELFKKKKC